MICCKFCTLIWLYYKSTFHFQLPPGWNHFRLLEWQKQGFANKTQPCIKLRSCLIMGPSFLEGGPIMYRSCPSVRLSRAYFFLRIVLGTWALTRTENEIPIVKILQGRPHSGRPPTAAPSCLLTLCCRRFQCCLSSYIIRSCLRYPIILGFLSLTFRCICRSSCLVSTPASKCSAVSCLNTK